LTPAAEARRPDRLELLGLAGILVLAAAVRAFAWSRTAVVFNDGPIFLSLADAIREGRFADVLAHPYHPLYPALVALVQSLPLPIGLETAAVAVSIFGGLLTVAALFVFARDAFGREVAWIAAWAGALHPWAVDFSADVMSDGLYAGLFMVGFAAMARGVRRPSVASAAGCGLAAGLAYLVRPEGVGLLIAATVLFGVRCATRPGEQRRAAGVALVVLLVVACLSMGPFVLAVGEQTGEITLTQKKSIADWVGAEDDDAASSDRLDEAALPLPEVAIRADGRGERVPAHSVWGALRSVVRVATTSLAAFRFELIPLALLGCWWLRRDPDRVWLGWTIGLPLAIHTGALVLLVWSEGYVSRRHALPPWLPVVALAALGARTLATRLLPETRRARRMVAVVIVGAMVIGWGPRDLRARRADRAPVREAAEWLALHHPGSGPVAAQKLRTAYYAGAAFVPLMPGHERRQSRYLRRRGARWVVIDEAKLGDHRGLAPGIGRWLEPVHTVETTEGRVLVLRVVPASRPPSHRAPPGNGRTARPPRPAL
jgi:hypothetical protein